MCTTKVPEKEDIEISDENIEIESSNKIEEIEFSNEDNVYLYRPGEIPNT